MKVQSKEFNAGGIKVVHMIDFGTTKKTQFEVWEYENGYLAFPCMNEQGRIKLTPTARQAVVDAIRSAPSTVKR